MNNDKMIRLAVIDKIYSRTKINLILAEKAGDTTKQFELEKYIQEIEAELLVMFDKDFKAVAEYLSELDTKISKIMERYDD